MSRKNYTRWLGALLALGRVMSGDAASFGTGANAFELTFQPISSTSNPSDEHPYGQVGYDYGIGTYEITASQWAKYVNLSGGPSGNARAEPTTTGSEAVNYTSWDEAAQFVNWLNTSSGYAPAYNFSDEGAFSVWSAEEQSDTSAFRHKDAIYVLPSEDEWVKAAYWSGTELQQHATPEVIEMTDMMVNSLIDGGIWEVGSGSMELNGTYDMMGNVWELTESAYVGPDENSWQNRSARGGSYGYGYDESSLTLDSGRCSEYSGNEKINFGFRVAAVPEPGSIALLGLFGGGIVWVRRVFMM
ncbi:MAG: SUMF1/EgtB/PvdO family nonheme iron enzyme [Pontiella sp.]